MQTQALQLRPYGYIYKLTNKINGKCYIGQSVNPKQRWYSYKSLNCKDQPKIYNALKKYGPNNFTYEIIATGFNKYNLDYLEDIYEILHDSIVGGYNIKRGGATGRHSENSKEKMRKNSFWLGRKMPQEQKLKISKTLTGNIPWNRGCKMSLEQRQKLKIIAQNRTPEHCLNISISKKGKKMSEQGKRNIAKVRREENIQQKQNRKCVAHGLDEKINNSTNMIFRKAKHDLFF